MKIYNSMLILAIALSGCASVRADSPVEAKNGGSDALSLCELAANGLAEGLTARIMATYKTDKSHYAYLSSQGCGKNGVLNVGDLEPIAEGALRSFYDSIDQRCTGTPYVCVIEAMLDADIAIIRGQDGKLAAEILKVHGYSFIEK